MENKLLIFLVVCCVLIGIILLKIERKIKMLSSVISNLASAVAANSVATSAVAVALSNPTGGLSSEDAASLADSLSQLQNQTAALNTALAGVSSVPVTPGVSPALRATAFASPSSVGFPVRAVARPVSPVAPAKLTDFNPAVNR